MSDFGNMVYRGGLLKIIEDLKPGDTIKVTNTGEDSYVVARIPRKPR